MKFLLRTFSFTSCNATPCHTKIIHRTAAAQPRSEVGYQCDYANKRLKIATREVKEWMKGQNELYLDLSGKPTGYLGARVSKRLATDLFARGVCRGAVECTNLILNAAQKDPTRAESIKTAQLTEVALAYPLQLLRAVAAHEPWPKEVTRAIVDKRCEARRAIIACPFWTMYGARGQRAEALVWLRCVSDVAKCKAFLARVQEGRNKEKKGGWAAFRPALQNNAARCTCCRPMSLQGNLTSPWQLIQFLQLSTNGKS